MNDAPSSSEQHPPPGPGPDPSHGPGPSPENAQGSWQTVWIPNKQWIHAPRYSPVRQTAGAVLLLGALILASGLLIWLTSQLDAGPLRDLLIPVIGILTAVIFMWLMILRVRDVLQDKAQLRVNAILAGLDIAILIGAFAWVHHIEGLIDSSVASNPVVYDYVNAVEFVVLNFTTLGAPHLYPLGHGRLLIAVEGLIGYLVLGLFTVAAVTYLSRKAKN